MIIKNLDPGDTIVINTETLKVSLNGSNGVENLEGELLDLAGGSNTLEYSDDESGRDVDIEITYEPRYL